MSAHDYAPGLALLFGFRLLLGLGLEFLGACVPCTDALLGYLVFLSALSALLSGLAALLKPCVVTLPGCLPLLPCLLSCHALPIASLRYAFLWCL